MILQLAAHMNTDHETPFMPFEQPLQSVLDTLAQRVDVCPDDMDAVADLAGILAGRGRLEQALGLLLPAVRKAPRHAGLKHNLAEVYRNMGELRNAELLFSELIVSLHDRVADNGLSHYR